MLGILLTSCARFGSVNRVSAFHTYNIDNSGYWHQRADERHGITPQGNQMLVVKDKVGRPQVSLG